MRPDLRTADNPVMEVKPSPNVIGGEVTNVDLSAPLTEDLFAQLRDFFYERSVIAVRGQSLRPEDLLGFAGRFGEPDQLFLTHYALPSHPQVLVVSNIVEDGKPVGFADAGRVWHSDGSYLATPVAVTLLYALEVPVEDDVVLGATQFASAWAAYEGLSPAMKARIAALSAVHEVAGRRRHLKSGKASDRAEEERQPDVVHPLVRTHDRTGRPYIFAAEGECTRVLGMEDQAGLALISELAHAVQAPEYRHTHEWQVGDLLIWDNQAVQHLATFDYEWPRHRRLMHRVTVPESATR